MQKTLLLLGAAIAAVGAAVPTVQLLNGVNMPMISAGVWQYNSSTAEEACGLALEAGFDHFDTAHDYGNQDGVGEFFKDAVAKKGRDALFLTSKVPGCGLQGVGSGKKCYNDTIKLFEEDLTLLGVDHVDLMLIHFPPATGCNVLTCTEIQSQWSAFEAMYAQKKARAIGVSNYCISCFKCLNKTLKVVPMVNQIEYHVGMGTDPEGLKSYLKEQNIAMQAYSPLGDGSKELITGKLTTGIGARYNKTGAQVALRWITQSGVSLSTKADNEKYLLEDIDVFGWDLSEADMASLNSATAPAGTPSFMCKA